MAFKSNYDIETDYLYKQGMQQATKNAIVKFLKSSKLTIEEIAEFLSVSVEEVLEIKTALEKENQQK